MLLFVLSHLMSLLGEFLFVFLFYPGEISTQKIDPLETVKRVSEGDPVTLSCNYTGSEENLLWYRQYSNSWPQFLVLVTEYGQNQTADSDPRLSAHLHKSVKRVDLKISSAAVSDSALYYCALRPTVTGKHHSLYKNLCRCD
uniref:Ig-like domain-containing protein n=1 Tax=Electrophorus electricus TaxID=8005 RepID=A0AAY5EN60_ELEEL